MSREYKGCVVEESLDNNLIVNELDIARVEISQKLRWHLYHVRVSEDEIKKLSKHIKPRWYMHFWQDRNVIAVFKDKTYQFNFDDKDSWEPAIEYGLAQGIPKAQLDFPID